MRGEHDSVAARTERTSTSNAAQTGVHVVKRYGADARRIEAVCGDAAVAKVRDTHTRRRPQSFRPDSAGAAEDSIGRLTRGIAHDLNNQLGVVLNYSYILRRQLSGQTEVKQHLEQLREAAWNATQLTDRLSSVSRARPAEPRSLCLNDIILSLHPLLTSVLGDRIRVRMQLADELWSVRMAASQVEQMLVNIAVHARDAMGGEGLLTFRTANVPVGAVPLPRSAEVVLDAERYVLLAAMCPSSDVQHPELGEQPHRLGPIMVADTAREAGGLLKLQRDSEQHRLTLHLPAVG